MKVIEGFNSNGSDLGVNGAVLHASPACRLAWTVWSGCDDETGDPRSSGKPPVPGTPGAGKAASRVSCWFRGPASELTGPAPTNFPGNGPGITTLVPAARQPHESGGRVPGPAGQCRLDGHTQTLKLEIPAQLMSYRFRLLALATPVGTARVLRSCSRAAWMQLCSDRERQSNALACTPSRPSRTMTRRLHTWWGKIIYCDEGLVWRF
jgi:hypothetical protein